MHQTLENKIAQRSANIAVIGLGYVGLPLAVALAQQGFKVFGIDSDPKKIQKLQAGQSYIPDIPHTVIKKLNPKRNFLPGTSFQPLGKADCIIICVPTPLRKSHDPDISYIVAAATHVRKHLRRGQLIVLESTSYPGTTEEVLLPQLTQVGLKVGKDFFLVFSPERIDPGNKKFQLHNTPKIVGGCTPHCTKLASLLYGTIVEEVHTVSDPKTAEMAKLLENTFRAVNIGLVNEIAIICHHLQLDTWEVLQAAATKPFGYMPFYPGPGLGGHCIPVDPHYLSWKLRTVNYRTRFIELATEVNQSMPNYVVQMLVKGLNQQRKAIQGAKLLILGVAYKKNVSDTRESPAYEIYQQLKNLGAKVDYHDPFVPHWKTEMASLKSIAFTPRNLKKYAAGIIIADHETVDYRRLVSILPLIIDTRNATQQIRSKKIFKI